MKPIFIIGEQRSGSNLLRLMLSQAGIASPHPPHLIPRMAPLVTSYGDLSMEPNWRQLVDDCCALVERNPVPWNPIRRFNRDNIQARCRDRTVIAIFGALMDVYAEAREAEAWACKSMQNAHYIDEIDGYFGHPKYIFLFRDGRDVALSFTRAVVGEKHPYFIAKRWAELQHASLAQRDRVGADRFHSLCYEDLVRTPEPTLRALCAFLEIEFQPAMLSFHRSTEASTTSKKSQLWQNLNQPIIKDNTRKFIKGFDEQTIRIIESVAGEALDLLGYERTHVQPGEELVFSPEDVASFAEINEQRKRAQQATMDEADLSRRRHQLSLLTERVYFLKDLSHPDALRILAYLEERHYSTGSTVVEQGDTSEDLYFVIHGSLDVVQNGNTVAQLTDGAPFGEVSLVTRRPRTATIRANTPTRVFRMSRTGFKALEQNDPALAVRVLWSITEHLTLRLIAAAS